MFCVMVLAFCLSLSCSSTQHAARRYSHTSDDNNTGVLPRADILTCTDFMVYVMASLNDSIRIPCL